MNTKFKRHQKVKLLRVPEDDFIEPWTENPVLKSGMKGKINVILPNGKYHVEIYDDSGEVLAYVAVEEESLEAID